MDIEWCRYPFQLVPDDDMLRFPAAEGQHPDHESDTWFIAGELNGTSGRSFAFLTIFNKNRPGGSVVADFYTMALFDCDTGTYGTYTDYDMPRPTLSGQVRASWPRPQDISTSATTVGSGQRCGRPAAAVTVNCCPTPTG
ncbi:hypothetical protein I553_3084 [Mycobacterium xenopi 4042]|uniref:Uncharacterized protein n=1 Tax=Mycobacterium xenopi 4042 TaxID=1299334 RepID=X8E2T8_MYCXE|nr:hypothetical protein I552_0765 [Mycobacterium xenopi 3993]EUA75192.1 hypothetical protein I553_3084 [Mycobacterium xenopi 4042]